MPTHSRRTFLAAATTFAIVPRHVLGGTGIVAPSDKLNIAGVGVGNMGGHNVQDMGNENIVALCDVDHSYAAENLAKYPKANIFKDYREMLDKQKDIDAVVIGTPDHTHAVITMAALRAGKHVYCQKPIAHSVRDTRLLTEAAREAKVITQMGIQFHSTNDPRKICDWIAAGVIGKVRKAYAWCSLSYYPWGHSHWSSKFGVRPTEEPPIPATLDWDLWLGPAPKRPYHPTYHPMTWRAWWDFGTGMMGDRGAHTLDPIYWSLKLGAPETIEAYNSDFNPETFPAASSVRYTFAARGDMPPVEVTWYDGLRPAGIEGMANPRLIGDPEGGLLMVGDDGMISAGVYGNSPILHPRDKFEKEPDVPQTVPRVAMDFSNGAPHERNFVVSCKEGHPAAVPFDYAGPLTEMVLLGNVAKQFPGDRLRWDPVAMNLTAENDMATSMAATLMLGTTAREGWSL